MNERLRQVDSLFAGIPCSVMERLLIRLRLRLSSYSRMVAYVPDSGHILDLGCGFGIFSIYLALSSKQRCVEGMDIAGRRIRMAGMAAVDISNVSFITGDIVSSGFPETDCIVLIDALHYFPSPVQNDLLKRCAKALREGGTLLIRNADRARPARYAVTFLYERCMTRSGFTQGALLYFRPIPELRRFLEPLGFKVRVLPMWGRTPFADTLMVCRKRTVDLL